MKKSPHTVLSHQREDRTSNRNITKVSKSGHVSLLKNPSGYMRFERLSLEGEAGADLVGSLVKVLGIEGSTEAESDTRAEEDVVGQSGDTTVVDLGLNCEEMTRLVVINVHVVKSDENSPWRRKRGRGGTCWQPRGRQRCRRWSPRKPWHRPQPER